MIKNDLILFKEDLYIRTKINDVISNIGYNSEHKYYWNSRLNDINKTIVFKSNDILREIIKDVNGTRRKLLIKRVN